MDFMGDGMDSFRDITDIMKGTDPVLPPAAFRDEVMERLSWSPQGLLGRVSPLLRYGVTIEECFLYFSIMGSVHLILAIALLWGFRGNPVDVLDGFSWLRIQPRLMVFLGIWLLITGWVVLRGGTMGLRLARLSAIGYMEVALVNGILIVGAFGTTRLLIPFAWCTALAILAMGYLAVITEYLLRKGEADRAWV